MPKDASRLSNRALFVPFVTSKISGDMLRAWADRGGVRAGQDVKQMNRQFIGHKQCGGKNTVLTHSGERYKGRGAVSVAQMKGDSIVTLEASSTIFNNNEKQGLQLVGLRVPLRHCPFLPFRVNASCE